jgi:hypothetical protein
VKNLYPIGTSVWNCDGAPFDAFIYVETTTGKKLLLALQMKVSSQTTASERLSDSVVKEEHEKIERSIADCIPGTPFISVILGHREGRFNPDNIPENCVVISKSEQRAFYGEPYYHRLCMK